MRTLTLSLIVIISLLVSVPVFAQNWAGAVVGLASSNPSASGPSDREYQNYQAVACANYSQTFLTEEISIFVDSGCPEMAQYLQDYGPYDLVVYPKGTAKIGDYIIRKAGKTIVGQDSQQSSSSNSNASTTSSTGKRYGYSDSYSNQSANSNASVSTTVYAEVTLVIVEITEKGEKLIATSVPMTGSNTQTTGGSADSAIASADSHASRSRNGSHAYSDSNSSRDSVVWHKDKNISAAKQSTELLNNKNFQAFTYLMQSWQRHEELEKYKAIKNKMKQSSSN